MAQYNGHRSYNAWNVALWLNNDFGLYTFMSERIAANRTKDDAAKDMCAQLIGAGYTHTPDGVPYTVTNVRLAMVGM